MNMKIKQLIIKIIYPIIFVRRKIIATYIKYLQEHNLKKLSEVMYKMTTGKKLNWESPEDLNEKIHWLQFNTDTSLWTKLADKYLVREYIEEKGLSNILVKLYGVWDDVDKIDFQSLPKSFVLKSNHACGTVLLVKDKDDLNVSETKQTLNEWLKLKMGKRTAEPHYDQIKPLIIAEEFLIPDNGDLMDYKIFMAGGKPQLILVCSERKIGNGCKLSIYDTEWNIRPEWLVGAHSNDCVSFIPKPKTLSQMLITAEILSKDFPQVRVDFYEVNGTLYFGELTFTSAAGNMTYISRDKLLDIGKKVILPTTNI